MKRYDELDSLRGIASLIVVVYHVFFFLPAFALNTYGNNEYFLLNIIKYTPLNFFVSGTEAVYMFFILSGFVLSLPYYLGRQRKYSIYMSKRITRIYIPYISSVAIAIAAVLILGNSPISGLNTRDLWNGELSFSLLLEHLFMVGNFNTSAFNPPIWSLVHEMRISIIFPFIMFFALMKYDWKKSLMISILFTCLMVLIASFFMGEYPSVSYLITFRYVFMFFVGALLAKNIEVLTDGVKSLSKFKKYALLIFAWLSYTYSAWAFPNTGLLHVWIIDDLSVVLGSSIAIVSALALARPSKILKSRPLLFLGKISYSLYLIHVTVLFVLFKLLNGVLSFSTIGVLVVIVSVLIATIHYYLVEEPSIALGKKIGKPSKTKTKNVTQLS